LNDSQYKVRLKNMYLRDQSLSGVGEASPGQWETCMEGTCLREIFVKEERRRRMRRKNRKRSAFLNRH
jgi:hypothetical protein